MKQKDKDLSRLFSKTAPKKWGRASLLCRFTLVVLQPALALKPLAG